MYKSRSCREMAERVATGFDARSLAIRINIEGVLTHRNPKVVEMIAQYAAEGRNFVLFRDKIYYCIVIPCNLAVATYEGGEQKSLSVAAGQFEFMNLLKLAVCAYDNFAGLTQYNRFVKDRTDGDGAIPFASDRKALPDGKGYAEPSETRIPDEVVGNVEEAK